MHAGMTHFYCFPYLRYASDTLRRAGKPNIPTRAAFANNLHKSATCLSLFQSLRTGKRVTNDGEVSSAVTFTLVSDIISFSSARGQASTRRRAWPTAAEVAGLLRAGREMYVDFADAAV